MPACVCVCVRERQSGQEERCDSLVFPLTDLTATTVVKPNLHHICVRTTLEQASASCVVPHSQRPKMKGIWLRCEREGLITGSKARDWSRLEIV